MHTVKTTERIFQVWTDEGTRLANLKDLPEIVINANRVTKIEHLWNGKFTRISKSDLKALCESMHMPTNWIKLL